MSSFQIDDGVVVLRRLATALLKGEELVDAQVAGVGECFVVHTNLDVHPFRQLLGEETPTRARNRVLMLVHELPYSST